MIYIILLTFIAILVVCENCFKKKTSSKKENFSNYELDELSDSNYSNYPIVNEDMSFHLNNFKIHNSIFDNKLYDNKIEFINIHRGYSFSPMNISIGCIPEYTAYDCP